ncbi:MAG TPA: protein-disulfide reductase DsbD N-terminal domain-containing protein [Pyrinomonadaceae bacterium]|nr:protein-disulfide reductase DsbD N-terminal domain-containing protein [Pyrinomonadaceae bacterium]
MRKDLSRAGLIAVFVLIAASFAGAQSVTGSIANGSVTRGTAARGTIVLNIPGGLHVNSSRPNSEYAIATSVRVSSVRGVKVGGVSYPRGHNRKFEFSETALNVYEGRVSFPFTVTVPASFRGQMLRVNVSVKYQACTNEVCYPPKTKTITLTARVN